MSEQTEFMREWLRWPRCVAVASGDEPTLCSYCGQQVPSVILTFEDGFTFATADLERHTAEQCVSDDYCMARLKKPNDLPGWRKEVCTALARFSDGRCGIHTDRKDEPRWEEMSDRVRAARARLRAGSRGMPSGVTPSEVLSWPVADLVRLAWAADALMASGDLNA